MSMRSQSAEIGLTSDVKAGRLADMQRAMDFDSDEKCMRVRLMTNKICTVYERSVSKERETDINTGMKWLEGQQKLQQNSHLRSNTLNIERQVFSDKFRRLRTAKEEHLRQVRREDDIRNLKKKETLDWDIRHYSHQREMKSVLSNRFRQNVRRAETSLAIQRTKEKENHISEMKKTQQLFDKQRQAEHVQVQKSSQKFQRKRSEDELRERLRKKEAESAFDKEISRIKSKEWHRVQKERSNSEILTSQFEMSSKHRSKSVDLSPTSRVIVSPPPPKHIQNVAYTRLLGRTIAEREEFVERSLTPSESPTLQDLQLELLTIQNKTKKRQGNRAASPPPYDRSAKGW